MDDGGILVFALVVLIKLPQPRANYDIEKGPSNRCVVMRCIAHEVGSACGVEHSSYQNMTLEV